ncbi:hypothetical protein [Aerococcus mictus]|uniref:hypothetical protein n=1 Tax=Aerococcus mictus TaxID=2976810 RepID=UPI0018A76B18|nr:MULTISPECIES: hypothetical protein [Lactobacillales]MCY3067579.1 hypothetical protein [Aerococcus mictus]MCY3080886.1 hypothetical protein [Aerococcus mictus]MDK8607500.1 hypothetical protein [Lactobacillus paragasseri]
MKYLTGIYAMNIPCDLDTSGDWHWAALNWDNADFKFSDNSFYGDYGISKEKISTPIGYYHVANHIRAFLDLLLDKKYKVALGTRNDYIDNEKYTYEILSKVYELKKTEEWSAIDQFMKKEYGVHWLAFLKLKGGSNNANVERKSFTSD